jgi:AMP-polyphosphate phosphotransferase
MSKIVKHKSVLGKSEQSRAKKYFRSKEEYIAEVFKLQLELLDLQKQIQQSNKKVIILFEGPDAAGKGGVIKRLTEKLDPRGLRVHSIAAPNLLEAGQHYFQRFFERLPQPGRLAIFDRSWYGRVLVEPVEKMISAAVCKRAYLEINAVEKMWSDSGILVLKYFLDISWEEQGVRFEERRKDPLKSWKLTADDHRNRKKWDLYSKAFLAMLKATDTKFAPWVVVAADSKWFARVSVMRDVLKRCRKSGL